MRITFLGAARIVTGSSYLLEAGGKRVLVDCGMFQGGKDITRMNYEAFPFKPSQVDALLLTHAHIDHSGLIPKLVSQGFRGKIYGTGATRDLCAIMLEDSAGVQESDTRHENRRRMRIGLPEREPLYTVGDARASMESFAPVSYDRMVQVIPGISCRFQDAGHIMGSAIIEVFVQEKGRTVKVVFSGDLGQKGVPIVRDPTMIDAADYVLVESTYGNRSHEPIGKRTALLLKWIKATYAKGGKLLIPSFAVERTQELLYTLSELSAKGLLPQEKVYLDSPLAIKATKVFERHAENFDAQAREKKSPFRFPSLCFLESVDKSKALNDSREPCVIIAGSGMCNAGRIRHHLKHGLWDKRNTVLFVGYQAHGTLGHVILGGAKIVRMMGMEVVVRADIGSISSFSSHADREMLLSWIGGFKNGPDKVFVVHGEEASSDALKAGIEAGGRKAYVPKLGESVEL